MLRTEERYGASYIIDILLGSKQKRIIDNEHDKLSTWGIGKDIDKNDWFELSNCLVASGYLLKSPDYGVLSISDKGHDALRTRADIFLPVQFTVKKDDYLPTKKRSRKKELSVAEYGAFAKPMPHSSRQATQKSTATYNTSDAEAVRIATRLRVWRKHYAEELNVPPYVVFGDKTLADIATKKPQSNSELLNCYGIGEMKAEKFGSAVLRIVKDEE